MTIGLHYWLIGENSIYGIRICICVVCAILVKMILQTSVSQVLNVHLFAEHRRQDSNYCGNTVLINTHSDQAHNWGKSMM